MYESEPQSPADGFGEIPMMSYDAERANRARGESIAVGQNFLLRIKTVGANHSKCAYEGAVSLIEIVKGAKAKVVGLEQTFSNGAKETYWFVLTEDDLLGSPKLSRSFVEGYLFASFDEAGLDAIFDDQSLLVG